MKNHILSVGDKFGKWTVINSDYRIDKHYHKFYLCKCECGTEKYMNSDTLIRGVSKSCGCHNRKYNDIEVGLKYGKLTVIKLYETKIYPNHKTHVKRYLCKCECGNETIKSETSLKTTKNNMCDICRHDPRRNDKEYMRLLNVANSIRVRCRLTTSTSFHRYGGRGVTCELGDTTKEICESLLKIPGYFTGAQLDRINNDGNYTIIHPIYQNNPWIYYDKNVDKEFTALGNLRWVTSEENNLNRDYDIWDKDKFSSRLLTYKSFTNRIIKTDFNEDDFIQISSNKRNRFGLTLFLFVHKSNKCEIPELKSKFEKYWSDCGDSITFYD